MARMHRSVPSVQEIAGHQWFTTIQESQPNSISANALRFPEFLDSTSTWNQRHIIAFRMLDFNDLPLSHIYPTEFYPQAHDKVISEVDRLFSMSKDDVRKGGFDMIQTGAAFTFYRTLQECLRTEQKTPSPPHIPTRPQRVLQPQAPAHQYTFSDSSGSSFIPSMPSMDVSSGVPEDKTETVTSILLTTYLYLLAELGNNNDSTVGGRKVIIRFVRPSFPLICSPHHDHFAVTLEGRACGSENDGAAWMARWSQSTGQWVKADRVPLCSFEVI